ncbi:MAG: hypothetical protein ABI763_01795 [Bacteroidota bacterium]
MFEYLTFMDLIVPPIFIIIIYFISNNIKSRNIENNPSYRYYLQGLFVKLAGSLAICLVYVFYYQGGDTLGYYHDCVCFSRAFVKSPFSIIKITLVGIDAQSFYAFDYSTEWPIYSYDAHAFWVDKLVWPLCFISFRSYIATSLLLSFVCYQAIWRLYQTLVYEFPTLQRQMAIAVFFIPSVVFWGSGILKDSITFASVALFVSAFHSIIKIRHRIIMNTFFMFISSFLLIKIKPYIFFALLPGTIIWITGFYLGQVQNKLLKASIAPLFILISVATGYFVLGAIGNSLGDYRVDNVLNKAVSTQQDLKQDYYGGSSFDIGDFDPTISGILSKAPIAINAALFRPYLWEAYNPGMIVSGLENFILLLLTVYLLIKIKVFNLFRLMFRHHFLFFSVTFSLFFAFSVGLTTSNFGSLVRYKIPAMPLFLASLFVISETYEKLKEEDRERFLLKEDKKPFVVS